MLHTTFKHHRFHEAIALFLACLTFACQQGTVKQGNQTEGDTLHLKYAQNLTIVRYEDYTLVKLSNPWQPGKLLSVYALVEKGKAVGKDLPEGSIVVRTPVSNCVVSTAPHVQLLEWLHTESAIKGVCDAQYMKSDYVLQGVKSRSIVNCGGSMSPDVERILGNGTEAVMLSPYENGSYGKLEKLGIPLIACADYMEPSALGRAEWMKFYGLLFGQANAADSLFEVVDSNYQALKKLAHTSLHAPSVITERKTGSVWYCPGGKSSLGQLFADANMHYVYASDTHSGSLNLSPETVIDKAASADIWMFAYYGGEALSHETLLSEYKGYAQLKAFKTGNIYECNSATSRYFEEISFRPDFLLQELVTIAHPDVSAQKALRYYKKM